MVKDNFSISINNWNKNKNKIKWIEYLRYSLENLISMKKYHRIVIVSKSL